MVRECGSIMMGGDEGREKSFASFFVVGLKRGQEERQEEGQEERQEGQEEGHKAGEAHPRCRAVVVASNLIKGDGKP